jgi:hypothetical protein
MMTLSILTWVMTIRRIARAIAPPRRHRAGAESGPFPMATLGTATAASPRPVGPTGFYEVAEGAD